jgi:hypothetical protein
LPYLLVMKDKMSRKVMLHAVEAATAEVAAEMTMKWISSNGLPDLIYSDAGPHFVGRVMAELVRELQMDRVASVPYAPFTNGSVESAAGHAVRVCLALCSENKLAEEDWWRMLPLVELHINSRAMQCLGGRSPLEVCTGRKPRVPLDVIIDPLRPADKMRALAATQALTGTEMDALMADLADLQEKVVEESGQVLGEDRLRKNAKLRKGSQLQVQVGDWVMARRKVPGTSKMAPLWEGPHQVTDCPSKNMCVIQDLLTGKPREEHAGRLGRYSDAEVNITPEIRQLAARGRYGFVVQRIGAHRIEGDTASLQMIWRGFEKEGDGFNIFEDAKYVLAVIPNLAKRYLRKLIRSPKKEDRADGHRLLALVGLSAGEVNDGKVGDL